MTVSMATPIQDSNWSIAEKMAPKEGQTATDLRGRAQTINALRIAHQS